MSVITGTVSYMQLSTASFLSLLRKATVVAETSLPPCLKRNLTYSETALLNFARASYSVSP